MQKSVNAQHSNSNRKVHSWQMVGDNFAACNLAVLVQFCIGEHRHMDGVRDALSILSQGLDHSDVMEEMEAALEVLRQRPMSKADSLKKARNIRAQVLKGRDSKKVKAKLEKYNKSVIRKRDELQCISGKVTAKRLPVSEYKKWTPGAALKVCFTTNSRSQSLSRGASRMRRTRGTRPNAAGKRKSNPQARATCAAADFCAASSSYVQQIRDAVANLILERQSHRLDSISHYENAVLEILLDETELKISQRKIIDRFGRKGKRKKVVHVNTTVPALAVHGSIQFSSGDVAFSQEIVVPMIAMEAKTGSCMHNVIKRELKAVVDAVNTNARSGLCSWRVTQQRPTINYIVC